MIDMVKIKKDEPDPTLVGAGLCGRKYIKSSLVLGVFAFGFLVLVDRPDPWLDLDWTRACA